MSEHSGSDSKTLATTEAQSVIPKLICSLHLSVSAQLKQVEMLTSLLISERLSAIALWAIKRGDRGFLRVNKRSLFAPLEGKKSDQAAK